MESVVNSILLNADYFILLLLRVGALIISSPIFGRVNIPQMAKIGLVVALTYLFFVIYPPSPIAGYTTLFGFLLLCAVEILIGISLAFVLNVFFTLVYVSGQLMDMQIGFGIVNVYDPQNNTQVPVMGNILNITLLVLFFIVDGHLRLVEIIFLTLDQLPVGNVVFRPEIGLVALEVFALAFTLGIMVALPTFASGFVLEVAFGTLVRTVPQLNMFVVGMPMKNVVGLIVIWAILPVFGNFSSTIFTEMFYGVEKMFSTFLAG